MTANLNELARHVYQVARDKGYWEDGTDHHISAVANLHSEVSELFEAFKRKRLNEPCDKPIDLNCEEEELADIIIQALEYAAYYKVDIERAVTQKMIYNSQREWRHGGKLA
jgi:NTP pyrophosphatase (non-canonical NTP hydrolase)